MVYKYLSIEDNPTAMEMLKLLMMEYEDFQPTIVTYDMKEGIKAILTHKPDLLFLDVELPTFTGFEFIKELRKHLQVLPDIVMTTAHAKYALEAVNEDVLYYLLKPIDPDELFLAINKFKAKKAKNNKQIAIKNQKGYSFLEFEDILLLESSSNYTHFYTRNLDKIIVSKTMKEFESHLSDEFIRVHKSYIVNSKHIKFLNTSKKRIYLSTDENESTLENAKKYLTYSLLFQDDKTVEIPIGDAYLDIAKNTIMYNKIR